jgi:hypothetical protein
VEWKSAPLQRLQALPSNGRFVTKWEDRDEAFTNIAQGIRKALEDIQALARLQQNEEVSTSLINFESQKEAPSQHYRHEVFPIGANLEAQKLADTGRGDRKGREGKSPSSTQRYVDAPSTPKSRSVEDGFTPSRPLRSPGTHYPTTPKFAPMEVSPMPGAAFLKGDNHKNAEKISVGWLHRLTRFVAAFKERSTIGAVAAAVIIGSLFLFLFRAGWENALANNARATATAENNATATAIARINPNPYGELGGLLRIDDPLTQPYKWSTHTNSKGSCQFKSDGYHVHEIATNDFFVCANDRDMYSNFAFETQVTLGQGSCGGIAWHYNANTGSGLGFFVCRDGSYRLSKYSSSDKPIILVTGNTNVNSGENTIAAFTVNKEIRIYLNYYKLKTISFNDNDPTGYFGFLADDKSNGTENIYTKARLWVLHDIPPSR